MISRVRGTEDLLDLSIRNFCIEKVKQHLAIYNFNEIQTPILEYTNLFIHSIGESTDVVTKEMYIIDKKKIDGDKSICLRPENTASIIRACHENHIQRFPWKVFSYGPMFRYERPQKGRYRQFSQISMENIGSKSIAEDALFIKMLDTLFTNIFKLENYVININFLGTTQDRIEHKKALLAFLNENQASICKTCQIRKDKNTLRVFDCKNQSCKKLYESAPKIVDFLGEQSLQEWNMLQKYLEHISVNFVVNTRLVRGLDYYEKVVFEFNSNDLGAQNAFCGGGRYLLGKQVGAKQDFPSIGASIGVERLILLVSALQEKLPIQQPLPLHIIIPVTKKQDELALLLAADLQQHQLATDILFEKASLSNMMKKANKAGAKFALILGEDEQKSGMVTIKNMLSGENKKVALAGARAYLQK